MKTKLFCIPYAGGSARVFLSWKKWLDPGIELISVELTGRGSRVGQPLYRDVSDAVEDICSFITPELNECQYALFGHSMGSLLVYETLRSLQKAGLQEPVHVFFPGRYAPYADKKPMDAYLLDDEELIEFISSTFGTMDGLLENRDFLEFFLPLIRSDIKLVETYRHPLEILRLHCPVTFMTGIRDSLVASEDCQLWEKCTSGPFSVLKFDDGHFFIRKYIEDIVGYINDILVAEEWGS
jgi:surfactin synthase thioesterase subunit